MTQPQKKQKPSATAKKSAARLVAVQLVYEHFLNDIPLDDIYADYKDNRTKLPIDEGEELVPADIKILSAIIVELKNNSEMIEQMAKGSLSKEASFKEPLLKSILMCGGADLLTHKDIDAAIIISDYLRVSEAFYEGSEPKLVNAVLDKISKIILDEPV